MTHREFKDITIVWNIQIQDGSKELCSDEEYGYLFPVTLTLEIWS